MTGAGVSYSTEMLSDEDAAKVSTIGISSVEVAVAIAPSVVVDSGLTIISSATTFSVVVASVELEIISSGKTSSGNSAVIIICSVEVDDVAESSTKATSSVEVPVIESPTVANIEPTPAKIL